MPVIDIQRRAAQAGRIRIGVQVEGKNRKGETVRRPSKLANFRFTTSSRHAADAVAALLGGTVQEWTGAPTAGQWEVITERSEIDVMVPGMENAVDSWYELWTAAGCARRCNGEVEQKSQKKCLCPADPIERAAAAKDGDACRLVTRVNVVVPDLPGVGVWMLESHGYYAAVELTGAAELLAAASGRGQLIPARLRIDQREVRRPGEGKRQFAVPVLEVLSTLRELALGEAKPLRELLPPATPAVGLAIEAGHPSGQPEPASAQPVPRTAQDVANAAARAEQVGQVRAMWRYADTAGLLDHIVQADGSDALEPLREVLERCAADLDAGTERSAS